MCQHSNMFLSPYFVNMLTVLGLKYRILSILPPHSICVFVCLLPAGNFFTRTPLLWWGGGGFFSLSSVRRVFWHDLDSVTELTPDCYYLLPLFSSFSPEHIALYLDTQHYLYHLLFSCFCLVSIRPLC